MADEEDIDVRICADNDAESTRVNSAVEEIIGLVNRNQAVQAVKLACESFPTESNDEAIKSRASEAFVRALTAVEKSQVDGIIESSTEEERAKIMKYVCKGYHSLEKKTCDAMLNWHNKLVAKDGNAILIRVMTDKRV